MERLNKIGLLQPVHALDVKDSPLGIGFEKLDRAVFDPGKAYDKVAAIGVKWIRLQSGWARTESEKGVYHFGWLDEIVDNLIRRGLRPWLCLCYGNALYTPAAATVFGAVGCPPIHTDEEKQAWHNYVAALTAHFHGRIQWYEVWNEPDGQWCWKHGVSGIEYGEFVKATASAVKAGDPEAKVIGGSTCLRDLKWLNAALATGAAEVMDALTYHAYCHDEAGGMDRVHALRALCHAYNPAIEMIQGETGTQSRSDGAGALRGGAWTPDRQARFLLRHLVADLMDEVKFASYFSCMDMIEALNGTVGDKASYLDFGYFGVLAANFDENGFATGEYTPKPSYRALQSLAVLFRDGVRKAELPVEFHADPSRRIMDNDTPAKELLYGGFRKPNGAAAFFYWKPTDLLTTSFEGTVTIECAMLPEPVRMIDPMDGSIYEIPENMTDKDDNGVIRFAHLPVFDYPLVLTFGEFFR